jgi:hypothetical protein
MDFFYIKYDKGMISPNQIKVKQDFPIYFMSAFKTAYEHGMLTVSFVYKCNPILKGISPMSLTLELDECGKVTIQWKKSCGDFSFPPKGLGLDVMVPQKITDEILEPIESTDSFAEDNSKNFNQKLINKN